MKVKEVDRMANIAWSPESIHPTYLACGSAAQQVVDSTFNSSASLEIFDLNLAEPGLDMVSKYSVSSDVRFERLIWGKFGTGGDHPSGILVGGTSNGRVRIFDVAKCFSNPTDPNGGILKDHTRHSGPVYALDFNRCQANLLASGSVQSEVFIWDLNSPNQIPMTPGAKAQPLESVTALAWNPKVQHILASAFAPRAVVWDLRKNEPIIKVADAASRLKLKAVAWHPEVATQLCLASEDDMHPIIQLWDLRFASSPLNTMEAHQRGVLSLAWCKQDPDLMLSCGRDNRIICWNPNTTVQGGEIVCELKGCQEWCFDVSWCPRNPAVVAASSFDGHVSVFSLMGSQAQLEAPSKLAESFPGMENFGTPTGPMPTSCSTVDLKKPPKWLRRPCGVSWGFGGKLVSWQVPEVSRRSVSTSSPTEEEPRRHTVTVMQVITEPDLVAKAKSLVDALKSGQAGLSSLCSQRLQGLSVGDIRELEAFVAGTDDVSKGVVWRCIEAHLSLSARSSLLSLLGVGSQELAAQLGKAIMKNKGIPDGGDAVVNGSIGPEDAFESLSLKPQPLKKPFSLLDKASSDLCLALVGGHLDAALKLCMNEKRYGEALVLAHLIGGPVVRETQDKFLDTVEGGVGYLLRSLSSGKWDAVLEGCDVRNWRHALCAVLTYGKDQNEVSSLCSKMGNRLEADGKTRQALVCHMIGGDLEGVSRALEKGAKSALGNEDRPKHLQTLDRLELLLLLKQSMSCTVKEASQELVKTVKTCVEHLSSQGELELASNILGYFPEVTDPALEELRKRLASSSMAAVSPQHAPVQRGYSQPNRFARGSFSQPSPAINQYQPPQPASPMTFSPQQPVVNQPPVPTMSAPPPMNFGAPPTSSMATPAPPPSSLPPPPTGPAAKSLTRSGPLQPRYVADPNLYNSGYGVTQGPGPSSGPLGYNTGFQSQPPQNNFYNPTSSAPQGPVNMFTPTPTAPAQQSMSGPPPNGPPPMSGAAPPVGPPPTAPPPGWNDPPAFSKRSMGLKMKSQAKEAPAPIMQPVFAPVADPYASQMPQMGMGGPMNFPMGMGPPPVSAPMGMPSSYGPPMGMAPSALRPLAPMNMPMIQPMQHHQQQQPSPSMQFQSQMSAFAPPVAAVQPLNMANPPQPLLAVAPQMSPAMPRAAPSPVPVAQAAIPDPVAAKPQLAPEHEGVMEVLARLLSKCSGVASHPQMKRKLDDVSKKLDVLHGRFASNALSPATASSLQGLTEAIKTGEYPKAMSFHTQIVTTGAFSEISAFMPGIKILIQVAMQLGVYVN